MVKSKTPAARTQSPVDPNTETRYPHVIIIQAHTLFGLFISTLVYTGSLRPSPLIHSLSLLTHSLSEMGSRMPSHQLSNGLYVSGRPEQVKDRQPIMASRAVPYTGGDVKKSGELGKMFDIPVVDPTSAGPPQLLKPSRHSNSGSVRSGSNSGPVKKNSSSGPMPLQPTGLITSGPLSSSSSGGLGNPGRRSGQLDQNVSNAVGKPVYGSAVTSLGEDLRYGFKVSRAAMWVFLVVMVMALLVGAFMMVAVKKAIILVVVAVALAPVVAVIVWNYGYGKRGLLGFLRRCPDAELRGAIDGQFVKVTGVVTCGSIPLESSYQRVPRCVYVSTELYEYRGWGGKSANSKHRFFSWGSRHAERYVADFYISDFQSGLRALVKAGYGAKVAPFVKPATVVEVAKENKELSPSFLQWLSDHNLSSDDRTMRLKEGYIKEGSTVSVMGVIRRHENVLMIVPSPEPVSPGCRWIHCLLPTYIEGLILMCDESQSADVIAV